MNLYVEYQLRKSSIVRHHDYKSHEITDNHIVINCESIDREILNIEDVVYFKVEYRCDICKICVYNL